MQQLPFRLLPKSQTRACTGIECWAGEQKSCANPDQATYHASNGTFMCCVAGTCPVAPDADKMTTEYRMRMRISYTRDIEQVTPVDMETFMAPNCSYEYNAVPVDGAHEHVTSWTWEVDKDKTYVLGVGHMHSGALNLTVYHNDEYVCTSFPR